MEYEEKKHILLAINNEKLEEQIRKKIDSDNYLIQKPVVIDAKNVYTCTTGAPPDILILRDTLYEEQNVPEAALMTDLLKIRTNVTDTQIILLLHEREKSDSLVAHAIRLGIYSIITKDKISPDQVVKLIEMPATFADITGRYPFDADRLFPDTYSQVFDSDAIMKASLEAKDDEIAALKEALRTLEEEKAQLQIVDRKEANDESEKETVLPKAVPKEEVIEESTQEPAKTEEPISTPKVVRETRLILTAAVQQGPANSMAALHLSQILAQKGRTLLIECDRTYSYLQSVFRFPRNYEGLSGAFKAAQSDDYGLLMNFPAKCSQLRMRSGDTSEPMKQIYLLAHHSARAESFEDCFGCQTEKYLSSVIRYYLSQGFFSSIVVDMPTDNAVLLAHSLETLPVTLCCLTTQCNRLGAGNTLMLMKNVEAFGYTALRDHAQFIITGEENLSAQDKAGFQQLLKCSARRMNFITNATLQRTCFDPESNCFEAIIKSLN